MIDIESEIYNSIRTAVLAKYPKCYTADAILLTPPSYPCVYVIESDNTSYRKTTDSGSNENHASVMYTIEIYSNKVGGIIKGKAVPGKKAECKAIAEIIDQVMLDMGFERILLQQIPNINDATIYRMVGRYGATVSKDKVIYRR
ncbi:MAG: hypothetical protein PUF49_05015 [Firmicutes bacterium]|nr:hypothetical protein [Bacillota bacterium]